FSEHPFIVNRCLILVCFFDIFIVAPIIFRCGNFLLVLGGQIFTRVTLINPENVKRRLTHVNRELTLATTVVTGGFGRRAAISSTLRTFVRTARSICLAATSTVATLLFGPLYG
ncbi:MAG: hypothetical protein II847_06270, partial [Ruminobacter sp.]